jgi:WD40-like Beta Propeller Repeat
VTAKTMRFATIFSVLVILAMLQTACSAQTGPAPTATITLVNTRLPPATQTGTPVPTNTLRPAQTTVQKPVPTQIAAPTGTPLPSGTPTPTRARSATFTPAPTATLLAWRATALAGLATALAARATEEAVRLKTREAILTQRAQFPSPCDDSHFIDISPDGKWLTTFCGHKKNQTLVVQDKAGAMWTLALKDFLPSDTSEELGLLVPKFWSPEGEYLYFKLELGFSGGGNDCFPYTWGNYGLFRLSLTTGAWVTLIPPTDWFPGYGVEFSPTGQRYAAVWDDILITDLRTGELTQIDVSGVVEKMLWSPDGRRLAYSVASCGEDGLVQTSSVYVWEASTGKTHTLFTIQGKVLMPEAWVDPSILRVISEEWVGQEQKFTVYEYDLVTGSLLFTSTATPSP